MSDEAHDPNAGARISPLGSKTDLPGLLAQAAEEIRGLRRRNEVLEAQSETMNIFAAALFGNAASKPQAYGEDVVWKIEVQLASMMAKEQKGREPG